MRDLRERHHSLITLGLADGVPFRVADVEHIHRVSGIVDSEDDSVKFVDELPQLLREILLLASITTRRGNNSRLSICL
jgi:hypothetical protein